MITLFRDASGDLAKIIAKFTRRLPTEAIAPERLEAYSACVLVPLYKNLGVRPIAIRQFYEKHSAPPSRKLFHRISPNSDPTRTYVSYKKRVDFTFYSLQEKCEESVTKASFPSDTNSALNSLNRELAMKN